MSQRFTRDGGPELERHLENVCTLVLERVRSVLPSNRLQALVLGGGYGRGEGGVLKTPDGDQPYNDLEFYVFVSGSRLLAERRFRAALYQVGEELSPRAGLHVEFKIDSRARLRHSPVSMFSYDLISGHRVVFGPPNVFQRCEHHLDARQIPIDDATRLLFNRCTGLLLAREVLACDTLGPNQADFVGRNLAKAKLALGDAVLTLRREYNWSCLVRQERVAELCAEKFPPPAPKPDWLRKLQGYHRAGASFKLHPDRTTTPVEQLRSEHEQLSTFAHEVWLWIENRRLALSFSAAREYATAQINKCGGTNPFRNCLLNLNTFGWRGLADQLRWRYPRERLFNSLPLLLWNGEVSQEPEILRHLQRELQSEASDWPGLVQAYKQIWPRFG